MEHCVSGFGLSALREKRTVVPKKRAEIAARAGVYEILRERAQHQYQEKTAELQRHRRSPKIQMCDSMNKNVGSRSLLIFMLWVTYLNLQYATVLLFLSGQLKMSCPISPLIKSPSSAGPTMRAQCRSRTGVISSTPTCSPSRRGV